MSIKHYNIRYRLFTSYMATDIIPFILTINTEDAIKRKLLFFSKHRTSETWKKPVTDSSTDNVHLLLKRKKRNKNENSCDNVKTKRKIEKDLLEKN